MSDEETKKGSPDRDRINVHEKYELEYWSKKFGITPDELIVALEKELKRRLSRKGREVAARGAIG